MSGTVILLRAKHFGRCGTTPGQCRTAGRQRDGWRRAGGSAGSRRRGAHRFSLRRRQTSRGSAGEGFWPASAPAKLHPQMAGAQWGAQSGLVGRWCGVGGEDDVAPRKRRDGRVAMVGATEAGTWCNGGGDGFAARRALGLDPLPLPQGVGRQAEQRQVLALAKPAHSIGKERRCVPAPWRPREEPQPRRSPAQGAVRRCAGRCAAEAWEWRMIVEPDEKERSSCRPRIVVPSSPSWNAMEFPLSAHRPSAGGELPSVSGRSGRGKGWR